MFIGAYLCASGPVFGLGLLGLLLFAPGTSTVGNLRRQILAYPAAALPAALLGLLAFIGLSIVLGLMRFGAAGGRSYPGDYLSAGPAGLAVARLLSLGMIVPASAVLSLRPIAGRWRRARPLLAAIVGGALSGVTASGVHQIAERHLSKPSPQPNA